MKKSDGRASVSGLKRKGAHRAIAGVSLAVLIAACAGAPAEAEGEINWKPFPIRWASEPSNAGSGVLRYAKVNEIVETGYWQFSISYELRAAVNGVGTVACLLRGPEVGLEPAWVLDLVDANQLRGSERFLGALGFIIQQKPETIACTAEVEEDAQ